MIESGGREYLLSRERQKPSTTAGVLNGFFGGVTLSGSRMFQKRGFLKPPVYQVDGRLLDTLRIQKNKGKGAYSPANSSGKNFSVPHR